MMRKRLLAMLLVLVLSFCQAAVVFASEVPQQKAGLETEEESGGELSVLEIGDYLRQGQTEEIVEKLEMPIVSSTQFFYSSAAHAKDGLRVEWYDDGAARQISVLCEDNKTVSIDGIRCGMDKEQVRRILKAAGYLPPQLTGGGETGASYEEYCDSRPDFFFVLDLYYDADGILEGFYWNNYSQGDILREPLSDVTRSDWFCGAVTYVYNNWLMTGLGDFVFGPGEPLARAQFAVIIHRMENSPQTEYFSAFPDVEDEQWYTEAILWANKNKIVTGYANGRFGPADLITREQMAVMMYRYAKTKGYDTQARAELSGYNDVSLVSAFAKEAMEWCVAEGIISGKDYGTRLDPQANAARAECAAIIARFVKKYSETEIPEKLDYEKIYGPLVDMCANSYGEYAKYNTYFLYDINHDGVKEILLQEGTCEADYLYYIYTIEKGRSICLGYTGGGWTMFYKDESGGKEDYILRLSAHMGYERIEKVWIDSFEVKYQVLSESETEGEYYSNPYPLEAHYVTDKTGLR